MNFDGKATLSGFKDTSQISHITIRWYKNNKKTLLILKQAHIQFHNCDYESQ